MKTLLVAEFREGKLRVKYSQLIAFANQLQTETAMFLVGSPSELPQFNGTLYLADVGKYGEYNPAVHKQLLLDVIAKEQPDQIVFHHSSYGWDLAPRIAVALKAAQISEVIAVEDGLPVVPVCNAKLRRKIKATSAKSVLTLQAGAFGLEEDPVGTPTVVAIDTVAGGTVQCTGYEAAKIEGVDLTKAEIIVSAGRGVGKPENVAMVQALAKALGGEYGASRPVVDAGWVEHNRQVGTTGSTVTPKLYVACGISGAIQHLAGMKKSEFIVAINTDKDAPIGEVANVLVVADLKQFIPVLTEKLNAR
ncbi:Electron transfer flavoprotein alpha subunit [Desulfobulbus propionicus DSM 2032]|jgi:electron transfer flavoprotein alpha subunit|uniref:Electron transfer flavoprotein alpha subunit n=1 Tax=Desulfobulbus propionicus (strain ATCC 33891 / DSM 2032 / VKM B-1956 / 1pr3) TaxID=577650 RepID=A0A7U4DND5_DESPD|nr:electron transfer flavoprotein subunit alpha/FixB family protein [Desulfobulbus propionicus]ADW16914.1 Electron transfer flavoprotein alpha subunit [Desulfobulbus propionicus DSM 2032]